MKTVFVSLSFFQQSYFEKPDVNKCLICRGRCKSMLTPPAANALSASWAEAQPKLTSMKTIKHDRL